MITSGEGRHRVWLKVEALDRGRVYVLGGGERSHVGGAVVMEPGGEPRPLVLEGHRDHEVLVPIARAACERHAVPVVVAGGVHVDDATMEDIETIVENCRELTRCI